jgi:hypothetical protein
MAIIISTKNPHLLLDKIYEAIDAQKAEKWLRTSDGFLTYGAFMTKGEAFFKPQIWVDDNELRFGLLKRKGRKNMTTKIYTTFHAQLVDLLLSKFDTLFYSVTVSASKAEPDDY